MTKAIESNFIPGYCFLTGQFLIHFEKNKRKEHYKEVHESFLESTVSEPKIADFYYTNPSVLVMLCYGLIVYPLEFWKKQAQIDYRMLEDQIIKDANDLGLIKVKHEFDLFKNITSDKNDISSFIRSLRNAISHSHIAINSSQNEFTFWDVNIGNKKKHFEAVISIINLAVFLTGIGKFFINSMKSK